MDVTNTAKCLKIALFPKDNYKRSLVQDINDCFSMVDMYHQPEQYDMIYSPDQEETIIEEIIKRVRRFLTKVEDTNGNCC